MTTLVGAKFYLMVQLYIQFYSSPYFSFFFCFLRWSRKPGTTCQNF